MNQWIVQAICEGEVAFHAGVPLVMNPYESNDGATIEAKLLHLAWSMAWLMEEAAVIKKTGAKCRNDSAKLRSSLN